MSQCLPSPQQTSAIGKDHITCTANDRIPLADMLFLSNSIDDYLFHRLLWQLRNMDKFMGSGNDITYFGQDRKANMWPDTDSDVEVNEFLRELSVKVKHRPTGPT